MNKGEGKRCGRDIALQSSLYLYFLLSVCIFKIPTMWCSQLYFSLLFLLSSDWGRLCSIKNSQSLAVPCRLCLLYTWPYSWKGHLGMSWNCLKLSVGREFRSRGLGNVVSDDEAEWMNVWSWCGHCLRVWVVARALAVCLVMCCHRSGMCLCFITGGFSTCCCHWPDESIFSRSLGIRHHLYDQRT